MMQIFRPKISVIMLVHNRRHLIQRAIDSLLQQTYTDWELLIIDDGSTDAVHELLFPQMLVHNNFRYLRHSQQGVALSRNTGIIAALGEYITFLDSDDAYKPEHLQLCINYFLQHPQVDVLHGGVELIGPEESHWVQDVFDPAKKIHLSECTIGSTFFGKKNAFVDAGLFAALPYSAESEFLPRLQKSCCVEKVDFHTYIYYTGLPDSVCTRKLE